MNLFSKITSIKSMMSKQISLSAYQDSELAESLTVSFTE